MASKNVKDKDNQDKPVRINKWDGNAVKNALDDAVKEVLTTKFNYVEHFALMDGRLFMCGIAVGVAMFALLWDYLYPFPQSRPILIFCVSTYFIMMGILTLYTTYKEKGIFVVAIQKDPAGFVPDNVWEASSYLKKYDDKYNLVLSVKDGKSGACREATLVKSVANFIDDNGTIVYELLEPEINSTQGVPGFDLPRKLWIAVNGIRVGVRRCKHKLNKWGIIADTKCECAEIQDMDYIMTCALYGFQKGDMVDVHNF